MTEFSTYAPRWDAATIKRSPRIGDVVRHKSSGYAYVVTGVYRRGGFDNRIDFYSVASVDYPGRPNTLHPPEVEVVAAADAKELRAEFARNGGTA